MSAHTALFARKSQDDQLIILIILIIFVKQRTYSATLPDHLPLSEA
jgi:hypothetical protein